MNRNSTQLISEMKSLLNPKTTIISLMNEGLVYGEDGEEMVGGGEPPMNDEDGTMGQPQQQPQQQDGFAQEQNPLDGDPEITKLITNIRIETLQGMTKLAQNPETAQYELLKKIFLLVDKAVEDKVDPEK